MSDTKISAMSAAAAWGTSDVLACVQGGANVKMSLATLFHGPNGGNFVIKPQSGFIMGVANNGGGAALDLADDDSFDLGSSTAGFSGDGSDNLNVITPQVIQISAGTFVGNQLIINMDPVTPVFQILTNGIGIDITYKPGTAGSWNGSPPTLVASALDRCAALLKTLNGGTGP